MVTKALLTTYSENDPGSWRQLLLRHCYSFEGCVRAWRDCCWCDFDLKSLNQYSTVLPTNSSFGAPDQNKLFHKTESGGGWERIAEWICSLISILQILNQISLQPYIYQVSLLVGGLNKKLAIPFQSFQNHSWEREKVGLQLIPVCLILQRRNKGACFRALLVRYRTVFPLTALGSDQVDPQDVSNNIRY